MSFALRNRPFQDSSVGSGEFNVVFAGLAVTGFLNGSVLRMKNALSDDPVGAVLGTFGISVIVWVGIGFATAFLWASTGREFSRRDACMALGAFALFLVPAAPFSWIGLTLIAVYIMRGAAPASIHRRGAAILLAVTVPMFWSRLAFSLFGDVLLRIDAALVSAATGGYRVGNAIAFADGWGYYWIAPACSSVANISLAFLVYVLAREIPSGERRLPFRYGLLAIFSVVALNIARMGITGISRAHYDLMHGPLGATLAGWLSLAAMTGICWWGVHRVRNA
jgi:hypothetical protein